MMDNYLVVVLAVSMDIPLVEHLVLLMVVWLAVLKGLQTADLSEGWLVDRMVGMMAECLVVLLVVVMAA